MGMGVGHEAKGMGGAILKELVLPKLIERWKLVKQRGFRDCLSARIATRMPRVEEQHMR